MIFIAQQFHLTHAIQLFGFHAAELMGTTAPPLGTVLQNTD